MSLGKNYRLLFLRSVVLGFVNGLILAATAVEAACDGEDYERRGARYDGDPFRLQIASKLFSRFPIAQGCSVTSADSEADIAMS